MKINPSNDKTCLFIVLYSTFVPHSWLTIKQLGEYLSEVQYPLEKSLSSWCGQPRQAAWIHFSAQTDTKSTGGIFTYHGSTIYSKQTEQVFWKQGRRARLASGESGFLNPAPSSWGRRALDWCNKKKEVIIILSLRSKDAEPDWISAFLWKLLFRGINTCTAPRRSAEVKIARTEISAKEWNDSGSGWMNTALCLMATTCSSGLCWLHCRQARCESYF